MSVETCAYCNAYDMTTMAPIGPECGAVAVEILVWLDGRASPACSSHGVGSLEPDGLALLDRVVPLIEPGT